MPIVINGQVVEESEAMGLVRMLCNDAKKIAGEFYEQKRSAKFRANWPNAYEFADANWKTFVVAARAMYAERLGDPKTPPHEARKMHLALVLQAEMGKGQEADNRLQLKPNTQQFVGDPYENRKIVDTWGKRANSLRERLLGSSTLRFH